MTWSCDCGVLFATGSGQTESGRTCPRCGRHYLIRRIGWRAWRVVLAGRAHTSEVGFDVERVPGGKGV
jgi:hypothetical protein